MTGVGQRGGQPNPVTVSAAAANTGAPVTSNVVVGDPDVVNRVTNFDAGDQARSKRSRFMTLSHAITKSRTNFSFESSHA